MNARRLRRMLLLAAVGWTAAAAVVGTLIGRAIRHADRPSYTPQIDVPLWRGTDLPDPTSDAWPLPPADVVQFRTRRTEEHP